MKIKQVLLLIVGLLLAVGWAKLSLLLLNSHHDLSFLAGLFITGGVPLISLYGGLLYVSNLKPKTNQKDEPVN